MVSIGKITLIILFNCTTAFSAYLSVDNNIVEPEGYIQLSLTLEGDDELIKIKNIENFIVESQSSSSSYRYINGKASSQKTINYEITLRDPESKQVDLGPAVIKNNGVESLTNKIIIKTKRINTKSTGNNDKNYYMVSSIERNELMLNESVEVKVRFFNRIRLVEASIEEPESENFFLEQRGKEKTYRKIINGKEYNVTELSYIFTPTKPGELIIPAFSIKGLALVQDRNRQRSFGGFFEDSFFGSGLGKRKRIKSSSSPLSVNVSTFPESGRPESFNGVVGDFELSQNLLKVPQNNSYKLIVDISGQGDLSTLSALNLDSSDSFSIYVEKTEKVGGNKKFSMIIIPKRNGVFKLPKSEFSFYSIKDKEYKTLRFGGQEVVFSGVEIEGPVKKTFKSADTASLSQGDTTVSQGSGNYSMVDYKKEDIIIFSDDGLLESIYWFLNKKFLIVISLFIFFGFYFVYLRLIRKLITNTFRSKKPSFEKQLNLIIKKEEVSAMELLNWVRVVADSGFLNEVNNLEQLKNSSMFSKEVKDTITLLESAAYGKKSLGNSDFSEVKNNLSKIIQ